MPPADLARSAMEDDFSIVERLADAIRIEDDVRITAADRARLVQDLYEGPRKCLCCVNWIDQVPADVDLDAINKETDLDDESSAPLILRRLVLPGEVKSNMSVHSIEVRHAATRAVLCEIFKDYDEIVPELKYLVFHAPFKPFFWKWEAFERAIEAQTDNNIRLILLQLRALVKTELAEAFAVSKELVPHGVITFKYLWTIFPPGELLFSSYAEGDRMYVLESSFAVPSTRDGYRDGNFTVNCMSVDWDGYFFGWSRTPIPIYDFRGTRKISQLNTYPLKFHRNADAVKELLIKRGRKFHSLAGVQYKAYRDGQPIRHVPFRSLDHSDSESESASDHESESERGSVASMPPPPPDWNTTKEKPQLLRRIMLDARGHPTRAMLNTLGKIHEPMKDIHLNTGLITQAPVDATPEGGHQPLPMQPMGNFGNNPYDMSYQQPPPPVVVNRDYDYHRRDVRAVSRSPVRRRHDTRHRRPAPPPIRRYHSVDDDSSDDEDYTAPHERKLSDFHLQLCNSRVLGYCLRDKAWRTFTVDRVVDIEWNTTPFESLVLPEGYKDLILSFVQSQIKNGDTFDDVINGKGGGLVILLAGDPGVGKTLTAESVAEKIKAPLFKMELGHIDDEDNNNNNSYDRDIHYDTRRGARRSGTTNDIIKSFELASRWRAVLLIDECDLYLEKRGESSTARNRMVSRFLQELEYYPSLLFLTTNREKVLDPAIYSRIHLTINYPALDLPSRSQIWDTFLERDGDSNVTQPERQVLAAIEMNGRKIRNVVKTARIMAKQRGEPVTFEDIRKVMRITEGLELAQPAAPKKSIWE